MPKQRIKDEIWQQRIELAIRYKRQWSTLFKTEILQKYYEGFQWKSQTELAYNPYTINKVYETIQIKIAQFIPTFPKFLISARDGNDWELEKAAASAQLKEDTLNQICQDNKNHFAQEMEQAYKESFFAFGMVEVGYHADWILNPNAQKPLLKGNTEVTFGESAQQIVQEPHELPKNEQVYVKHIPAKTFFIGGIDHKYLSQCGWCGYYEYVDKNDLLAIPKLMNRDKISNFFGGVMPRDIADEDPSRDVDRYDPNQLKIWHLWDFRSNNRLIVVDSPCVTVYQRHLDYLNLFDFRPDIRLRTNGFYPIPPAFHWLSPQDEYNETREMLRAHRRRFVRKFQVVEGRIDDEELEKFETGPDGALIKVKAPQSIEPIQNADLGNALAESIATAADDLNRISGTSDETRGVADRTTATQATIVNQRTALRENKERDRIVSWFCQIGRCILLIVNKNFTGRLLVQLSASEGSEDFLGVVTERQAAFRFVTSEDLSDGYDFKIDVDLTSMSQAAREDKKKALMEFTAYLTQFPMVAFSPYLIREAAVTMNFRNEKAIAEFQKMALLMEAARMMQLQAAVGPQGQQAQGAPMPENGNNPQQIVQQATPPAQEQIRQQLMTMLPQGMQQ